MSKAYKCDICGKLFEDCDRTPRNWYITHSKFCGGVCLDICETCQDKLDNFVENKEKKVSADESNNSDDHERI